MAGGGEAPAPSRRRGGAGRGGHRQLLPPSPQASAGLRGLPRTSAGPGDLAASRHARPRECSVGVRAGPEVTWPGRGEAELEAWRWGGGQGATTLLGSTIRNQE